MHCAMRSVRSRWMYQRLHNDYRCSRSSNGGQYALRLAEVAQARERFRIGVTGNAARRHTSGLLNSRRSEFVA